MLLITPVFASVDKSSCDYLKNKKHFSIVNPFIETIAQNKIKKSLKKSLKGDFNVNFDGYTLSSMKNGVFKKLDIVGTDLFIENIEIPYLRISTITDYNRLDYSQKPIVFKSDMIYSYEIKLSEQSVNQALEKKDYEKNLEKINNLAYPLFILNNVDIKLKNNKIYLLMYYNFPVAPAKIDKTFMISTSFKVENHRIKAYDIDINKAYGVISETKVANLLNLLDPLTFTLSLLNTKKCNAIVENVKIIDNIIVVNGKIYVKGE